MSTRFTLRYTMITVAGFLVVALGACQPAPVALPSVTSELSDSSWPTSDDTLDPDQVFEAAHRLIGRYLATTDTITQDGGQRPSRMATLTTPAWFLTEEAAFAHYLGQGLRTIGDTVFDSLVIQSVFESATGQVHVDAIVCVDASWVWLLPAQAPDPPEGLVQWLRWGEGDSELGDEEFDSWSEYLDLFYPIPGEREAIVLWLVGDTLGSLAVDGTVNWEGADACHTTAVVD
jgi:hypothetical protein